MNFNKRLEITYAKNHSSIKGYLVKKFGIGDDCAEDIIQQAVVTAIERQDLYDQERSLRNWL